MHAVSDYESRKAYFDSLLTLYGRKPVLEALASSDVEPVTLHLADSNRDSPQLREMQRLIAERGGSLAYHSRRELARISRNGRQDQGVALDIKAPSYLPLDEVPEDTDIELIAIDGITNPQNLGLVVRSVGASPLHGIVLPRDGNARIDGLVIKASAGAVFKTHIYHCETIDEALARLGQRGFTILGMDGQGSLALEAVTADGRKAFVLGNETTGLSSKARKHCDALVRIALANGVESLNVSAAATVVAFRSLFVERA